ncbi:hypothetical protein [Actinophytocola oryzae]|nr:hypothetical protein [Actinophytocola oryzae]
MTAAERAEFAGAFHVDDPRWILDLVIFAVLLAAAYLSPVREVRRMSH